MTRKRPKQRWEREETRANLAVASVLFLLAFGWAAYIEFRRTTGDDEQAASPAPSATQSLPVEMPPQRSTATGTGLGLGAIGPMYKYGSTNHPNLLSDEVAALPWGLLTFAAPKSAKIGEPVTAEMLISLSASEGEMARSLRATELRDTKPLQISSRMRAVLEGDGTFKIVREGPEDLGVQSHGITSWRWILFANTPGKHVLRATPYRVLDTEAGETASAVNTFDHVVTVTVPESPLWTFLKEQWPTFAGVFVMAAAGAIVAKTTTWFSRLWTAIRDFFRAI